MSITLKPEQERVVQTLLEQGDFETADEVLQTALALLEAEREVYRTWLAETRTKVEEGMAALAQGDRVDGETFVQQLLEKRRRAKEV